MEGEIKAIKEDLLRICWFMRGGVTFSEVMNMSAEERQIVSDLVKENIEVAKKTGLPFF